MSAKVYIYTIIFLLVIFAFDLTHAWRNRNKITTAKSATKQISIYIAIAITFGILMRNWTTPEAQESFFAAWTMEYSLSLDNLFVFILIFRRLRIEQEKQEVALFAGISLSLVLRGICLIAGVALLNKFAFMNFGFAALLFYTAFNLLRNNETEWEEGKTLKWLRSRNIHGMRLAFYAIAITDLMFAFDSIPAVIGITKDPYVILTSNFLALMGLRQLYFLVERLVERLYYLGTGIGIVLLFISTKLIVSALQHYGITEISGIVLPIIETHQSLIFIASTLSLSVILSLIRKPEKH